jgi:5-oxoprolinase (ATP-hydrolysing)
MTWQFWLDVGGTFTDCLARRPDGKILRRKVLSSAITKGQATFNPHTVTLHDPTRTERANFWTNYTLRLLDPHGQPLLEAPVTESTPDGHLKFAFPIPYSRLPTPCSYELLSSEEAPLLAIRLFLGLRLDEPLPPCTVRLGTTRGTNALLTRRGAKTAFVTTRGFADILRIGYQNRPKLFDLAIKKTEPLFVATAEIDERIAADGSVLQSPSESQINQELTRLKTEHIESLAICLLNSYANPAHELQVENLARAAGFTEISVSHRVSPLMKIVPRGDTTVVDAYLNPVLKSYIDRLSQSLRPSVPPSLPPAFADFRLMTSAGGLASAAHFTGKDSLLSGPAGGGVGFSKVAEAAGFSKAIGFDMGGTSTDVSRYDGRYEYEFETEKAGVRIVAPMLAIETVAAGGGSICRFDGVKLVVGPDSAGADPGPACYGRGGPLTITDCNLLLGRIVPDHFPFALKVDVAEARLNQIAQQLAAAGHDSQYSVPDQPSPDLQFAIANLQSSSNPQSPANPKPKNQNPKSTTTHHSPLTMHALAEGFLRIANANMAAAIRSISLAKGYDPRDYCLVAFGAAAPQHACAVAAELGITKILIHSDAGVLSALGIGLADVVKHRTASIYQPLEKFAKPNLHFAIRNPQSISPSPPPLVSLSINLRQIFHDLETQARSDVLAESIPASRIETRRSLDLRYQGTDAPLTIAEPENGDYEAAFIAAHRHLYGYVHKNRPLEIVAARAQAIGRSETRLEPSHRLPPVDCPPHGSHQMVIDGQLQFVPLYHREKLPPGASLAGPALIVEPLTTTILDPHWSATALSRGELLLESTAVSPSLPLSVSPSQSVASPDPILLELFNNHLTSIATQMGITLRNTSMSVNVKERLDFSCAIFTANGDLVVNAPHIPVHLGAMSQTVKQIIADNLTLQPGDAFITNDPYRGGSHLPDITVITPVFASPLITHHSPLTATFFTASRAHHAEIGGVAPGSMPPFSKNLAEEGVLIQNFKLIDAGQSRFDELKELLTSGPYPSRSPDTNLADITAQVAANQQGAADLQRMVRQHSLPVVQAYMRHIQDAAERKTRAALSKLPPGPRQFTDHLDDGTAIHVTITVHPPTRHSPLTTHTPAATIDFTGTGPIHPGNLNANPSIVTAAVIYVLRLLINEDIPLNQGVLKAVELIIPTESILNPMCNSQFAIPNLQSESLPPSVPPSLRPPLSSDPRTLNYAALPAVVGGNVETSQRIVDCLLGAFGLAAASQGTMNNFLFGDHAFGYYETICGGSGATAESDGADAVHTHMTNTRLTDPEVLEARYPVRLHEFSIRRGSGGAGLHRGGDGVIRRLEFLKPLTLSILSQRRGPYPPYGLHGGAPGALGRNSLRRVRETHQPSFSPEPQANTPETPHANPQSATHNPQSPAADPQSAAPPPADSLPALVQTTVDPGDVLTIETPGGGGFGSTTPEP